MCVFLVISFRDLVIISFPTGNENPGQNRILIINFAWNLIRIWFPFCLATCIPKYLVSINLQIFPQSLSFLFTFVESSFILLSFVYFLSKVTEGYKWMDHCFLFIKELKIASVVHRMKIPLLRCCRCLLRMRDILHIHTMSSFRKVTSTYVIISNRGQDNSSIFRSEAAQCLFQDNSILLT